MFWKFNLLSTSRIDTLLDNEGITLHELMDEDDILQECKAQNSKLVNFLVLPENMEEMVKLITEEPEDDVDEKVKYKYPNTACELLTSDVSRLNDALAGSEDLINRLYSFLDSDNTLNPLLASFFSKVMGLLITRKSEMILEYLKAKDDFVGTLLRHIGTSAIMDLLLRLLTCIESPEIRHAMVEWLNDEQIVKKLVNIITPEYDEDIHCNAAQSLCDIVRLGREQVIQLQERAEPDPLLTTVEMEETISELLDNMLSGERSESVIVNGLSVIQTLLEFKKQGPEDSAEQMIPVVDTEKMFHGVNSVLTAICPRLKDFHNILVDPPKQRFSVMPTTAGDLDPPLGNTRLQTARLISSLLLTNTHSINLEISQLGTINLLLNLYFKFIWNNFLHTHVCQCLYTILNKSPVEVDGQKETPLLNQLFSDVNLIQRILDEWECNESEQTKEGGRRKGFMGHLTRIANDIVIATEKSENTEVVKSLVSEIPADLKERWETFLSETLAEVNKANTVEMVRGHPLASSSEDDDADFRDIPFPQDTAMQQAFSDYQLQQMTSNFIDQFGFNEEEFGEQEEKTDLPFTDRISSIDFGVSVNEDTRPNSSMFEQACNERQPQFDNDSDEDIWEEKEITFSPSTQAKRSERLPVASGSNDSDSTDSEEELDSPKRITQQPPPGEHMDVDSNEGWSSNFEAANDAGPVAMDTSPWDKEGQPSEPEKWADFTNKVPEENSKDTTTSNWADFSNFSAVTREENVPRSSSPVAMDTTEPVARTTAYLAVNKQAELVIQSVDDSDNVTETVDAESKSEDSANTSSEAASVTVTVELTPQSTDTQDDNPGPEPQPSESPPDKPPSPPSSPLPDDSDVVPQGSPSVNSTPPSSAPPTPTPSDCDSSVDTASPDKKAQGDGCNQPTGATLDGADDLSANFTFLTKVGLMAPVVTNCKPTPDAVEPTEDPADIQGNGPTNDEGTDVDNIAAVSQVEPVRTQTKESLESYDNAITAGASVQNGPV